MAKNNKGRHNNRLSPGAVASDSGSGTNYKQRGAMDISTALQEAAAKAAAEAASSLAPSHSSMWQKIYAERQGISWILVCAWIGWILGFGIGTGHLTGGAGPEVSPWRVSLGAKIRATTAFQRMTFQETPLSSSNDAYPDLRKEPSHPRVFSVLREAVIREESGYIHPDLGFLLPAPSGAARGLGMIRSSFQQCQSRCMPGIWMEKLNATTENQTDPFTGNNNIMYMQEEVLVKIPLNFQVTRTVAITTLTSLIPVEHHRRQTLQHLDDAALIVMFLAHERGLSQASRWLPYIASLPANPSCGYSMENRPHMLDAIDAMEGELGLEVQGWKAALAKVGKYADTIAKSLATDYGVFLRTPEEVPILENLKWALCHVASRATAGSNKHGTLRLVPIMDLINHDASAGPFVELTGKEKMSKCFGETCCDVVCRFH